MPTYRLTNKALEDLRSIARYTEENWGREQRNRYLIL
jgi:toxin ParE1/3/4